MESEPVKSDIEVIFCDESCHLEHDRQPVMLVGCVWADRKAIRRLNDELDAIKEKNHARGELKWQKVSQSRLSFFLEVVDWFFASADLRFRAVVVADKAKLNHAVFNRGSHDEFYYKLYYQLLHRVLQSEKQYEVYIDLKDTRGRLMLPKLREVLSTAKNDFQGAQINNIQNVHSREVALVQVADFLLGAVSYRNRGLSGNEAKSQIVERIEKHYQKPLVSSSPMAEEKFDVFIFHPKEVAGQ